MSHGTGPCSAVLLLHSPASSRANHNSPLLGWWQPGVIFSCLQQEPQRRGNTPGLLTEHGPPAFLLSLKFLLTFQRWQRWWEMWGWEKEALAVQGLKISKIEGNALGGTDQRGHLLHGEPQSFGRFAWRLSSPCEQCFWPLTCCINLSGNTKQCWNRLFYFQTLGARVSAAGMWAEGCREAG